MSVGIELVTLAEAKSHLRVVQNDEDLDITLKIQAASAAVINYLKTGADAFLDSSGLMIEDSSGFPGVPDEVRIATLYLIGVFYKDRDGQNVADWERGYLPATVVSLLYPLRDPACE